MNALRAGLCGSRRLGGVMRAALCRLLLLGVTPLVLAPWTVARAQGAPVLSGIVTDLAGRPLEDAEVSLVQLQRRARTRSDGSFRFEVPKAGKYTVNARRVGFATMSKRVTVSDSGATVRLQLERMSFSLPSVVTTAERGGLSGVIADSGFHAMPGVAVRVLGTAHHAETDSAGGFFTPVKPGQYLVELTRAGYARQLVSVTVPEGEGRKIAAWMMPSLSSPNPRIGANLFEMNQRMTRANPSWSKFFTREDMEKAGLTELQQVASFADGALLNPACTALLDGGPTIAQIWEIPVEEIEFVEAYTTKPPTPKVTSLTPGERLDRATTTGMTPGSGCRTSLIVWLRH